MGMNKRYPSTPAWHPILDAQEYQPGRWVTYDAYNNPFALIDFIRRGPELGYRVNEWAQNSADQKTIGYYTTLRAAVAAAHQRYIRTRSVPNPHPLEGHSVTTNSRVPTSS